MKIHKRHIDLNATSEVVKVIVSTSFFLLNYTLLQLSTQTSSVDLIPGVEVEVTIST